MNAHADMTDTVIQADWYKDALIYQCHVKAYQDSNNDGIGDFKGLMQRLDHIESLGVTAIWILPFYPSPLRDDGYDIAEFKAVNPQYGDMDDFQNFVDEAHRRGLKVITELVINHTSDQHEWFQRARRAPKGSPERDFYVWSDDPTKWMDTTRVIFNDTHDSNWSWDAVAEQFYWHRFFDHQPDLNFDNPAVLEAVIDVMHFWLDKGVDGLRLDAIPYLVERDGTNNENLEETHDILKAIRADLDKHYEGKMLLAEANQWPEDTRPYFGEGDECHMGFHFPLMPRMYMAVAQEDRHPITDILRQTPDIPEDCQWAIFLRNHDELTLEMVTDKERDYLWETYAADKRARINMGIRRRLAPLMQGDRRKIELLNSLLLSMPGTPILYYGDEIGMGDNYYLGDRDGVRTPMQWSSDRNAGFSRADPQQLYLPVIQDPVYGFNGLNVEAQAASPSSYLNWIRRMVAVRQRQGIFGRGAIKLLYPSNRKVLAFIRQHEGEAVLCVANLSRTATAVELDLSEFIGRVPVELTGQSPFPPVGELPYLLTLSAYGFYWFRLSQDQAPDWHTPSAPILSEIYTLVTRDGTVATALAGREAETLRSETLPKFLALQRWFAGKGSRIDGVALRPLAPMGDGHHLLAVAEVATGGETQRYFLPLSAVWEEESTDAASPLAPATIARLRQMNRVGALVDGTAAGGMARALVARLQAGDGTEGPLTFTGSQALRDIRTDASPRALTAEQSNATIAFGDQIVVKLYRRLRSGVQPDIEIGRFLTQGGTVNTPALLGTVDWTEEDGTVTTLAAVSEYLNNQGDAWAYVTETLNRELEARDIAEDDAAALTEGPLDIAEVTGRRTAELHRALGGGDAASGFAAEPLTGGDVAGWIAEVRGDLDAMIGRLEAALPDIGPDAEEAARAVIVARAALGARLDALGGMTPGGARIRIHGDYHLGQVLVAQNDVVIIDFEGEPGRTLEERRAKTSPLRDVAGMLRSFDYALHTTLRRRIEAGADPERVEGLLQTWRAETRDRFLAAYRTGMDGAGLLPEDAAFSEALLDLFVLQKAVYEVDYELSMRPAWVNVPLRGLLALAEGTV